MRTISTSLEKQVHKLDFFVNAYLRVSRAVQEVQAMTSEVRSHVEHLYLQLNALALGHLTPSIMAPYELKDLLLAIKTKLPQTLRLPGDPEKDLWPFYKFLRSTSTTVDNKLLIILSIPLLDAQDTYNIFKIQNLPALVTNRTNSIISNGCSMVARYNLETTAIAVNTRRTQYILLTPDELERCAHPLISFCFTKKSCVQNRHVQVVCDCFVYARQSQNR